MVLIPSGGYTPLFKYGDDLSTDNIIVNKFYIDRYPVTNIQFKDFILKNPQWSIENISFIFANKGYLNHWINSDFNIIANMPVVNISWFAANAYCLSIGSRLPLIDEWEYVGNASKFNSIGKNDPTYLQDILDWYVNSGEKGLIDIKYMEDNYWGVFGMHGVIWEMVQDFNSVILLNTDAEGGGLEEVLYCGATAVNAIDPSDYISFMRFAFRNSLEADYTMSCLGFRCVKDI